MKTKILSEAFSTKKIFEISYHRTFLHENFVQLYLSNKFSRKIHNFFSLAKIWTPNLCCFTCKSCKHEIVLQIKTTNNFIFTICTKHANQQRISLQILTYWRNYVFLYALYFCLIFFSSTVFNENTTTQLILWNSWNEIFGCSPRISASIEQTPRHSCRLWLSLIL